MASSVVSLTCTLGNSYPVSLKLCASSKTRSSEPADYCFSSAQECDATPVSQIFNGSAHKKFPLTHSLTFYIYSFSATLSFALLARGFFFNSSPDATIGFLVITLNSFLISCCSKGFVCTFSKVPCLKKFFTNLSSRE